MIEERMNELYQAAFDNPKNLQHPEPPNFLQGGNLQLRTNPQQANNMELPNPWKLTDLNIDDVLGVVNELSEEKMEIEKIFA